MKKKLPFEEAIEDKLRQAALPDKEQSWQAMEVLLDKKKKRRGIFFFIRYTVLLAFLLLAGSITWMLLQKENSTGTAIVKENNTIQDNAEKISEKKNIPLQKNEIDTNINTPVETAANNTISSNSPQSTGKSYDHTTKQPFLKKNQTTNGRITTTIFSPPANQANDTGNINDIATAPPPGVKDISGKANATTGDDNMETDPMLDTAGNKNPLLANSSNNINGTVKTAQQQLTANTKADTNASKKTNAPAITEAKQKSDLKKFVWSAGIAIQQQIPVGGQKITKYGFNGSSNVIDNYIPAVYVRWQKKNKWFIQAEFGYGVPRPVAEFSYSRTTEVNSASTEISITTLTLKKTYYHEVPVSFNYYIKKNWSVGAGVMYGILHRSVTEREQSIKNIQSQQETRLSNIITSGFTDSFLYKKQYHWLLQTNYEWRKLSFGIRYSRDVFPYIKYAMPSGELNEQKNQTLGFIISLKLGRR